MEALLCAFNIIQFDRLTEMLTITNKLAFWSKKFKILTCSSSIRYHCMFLIFQKFLRYLYEKNLLIGTRSFCIFEISHERQIFILIAGILVQLTPSTIYLQQLKLTLQGFPFGLTSAPTRDILSKMAKNCMNITKSTFLRQNSRWNMGDKPIFWIVDGDLPKSTLQGTPFIDIYLPYSMISTLS